MGPEWVSAAPRVARTILAHKLTPVSSAPTVQALTTAPLSARTLLVQMLALALAHVPSAAVARSALVPIRTTTPLPWASATMLVAKTSVVVTAMLMFEVAYCP